MRIFLDSHRPQYEVRGGAHQVQSIGLSLSSQHNLPRLGPQFLSHCPLTFSLLLLYCLSAVRFLLRRSLFHAANVIGSTAELQVARDYESNRA